MAQMKNVKRSKKKSGSASPEIGAPTTYSYGKSGSKGRKNMSPTRAADK